MTAIPTPKQAAVVKAAVGWARRDLRVRALLLKGSLGRGAGDERSDVDLVIVTAPGRLVELWSSRRQTAEGLGRFLGGFDEVPWQAAHTFLGFYDGPVKVDFFYQEGEPIVDPWLREGFQALVDLDGLADALRARLSAADLPDISSDFDAHAWDWLWWLDVKLSRQQEPWLIYFELVKFVETILLAGHNVLSSEPWRGASTVEERLSPQSRQALRAALPTTPDIEELQRALDVAVEEYVLLRQRLSTERRMPLAEELGAQVLPVLHQAKRDSS